MLSDGRSRSIIRSRGMLSGATGDGFIIEWTPSSLIESIHRISLMPPPPPPLVRLLLSYTFLPLQRRRSFQPPKTCPPPLPPVPPLVRGETRQPPARAIEIEFSLAQLIASNHRDARPGGASADGCYAADRNGLRSSTTSTPRSGIPVSRRRFSRDEVRTGDG